MITFIFDRTIHLTESGIYNLWNKEIVESLNKKQLASVRHLHIAFTVDKYVGGFIIYGVLIAISYFVCFFEINCCKNFRFQKILRFHVSKKKSKQRSSRRKTYQRRLIAELRQRCKSQILPV